MLWFHEKYIYDTDTFLKFVAKLFDQDLPLFKKQQLQEPPKDMDKVATHTVKTEDSKHLNLFPAKFVAYYPIASPYNSFSSELEIVKK